MVKLLLPKKKKKMITAYFYNIFKEKPIKTQN